MKKLRIRFNENTVDAYFTRHRGEIAEDHVFLPTNNPLEPRTHIRFELMLVDRTVFLAGSAMVAGEHEDAQGRRGMMLWFEALDSEHSEALGRLQTVGAENELRPAASADLAEEEEETKPEADPAGIWTKYMAEGSDPS